VRVGYFYICRAMLPINRERRGMALAPLDWAVPSFSPRPTRILIRTCLPYRTGSQEDANHPAIVFAMIAAAVTLFIWNRIPAVIVSIGVSLALFFTASSQATSAAWP